MRVIGGSRSSSSGSNLVFQDQCRPQHALVFFRLPGHVKDLFGRPEAPLRVAMTVEAPLHLKRLLLPHQGHLIDSAVAAHASDALLHVDAVVEVDEVGKIVNAGPLERPIVPETRSHRLQHGAVGPDLRVASHTGLRGRQAGEGTLFDRRMAVAAVESETADVVLVAEGDRLLARYRHLGQVVRPIHVHHAPQQSPG